MPQYIYYQWKQYPVPIQYSLPKWINAAEAGVIIDWSADVDDLLSFVPEWIRKWFVSVSETSTTIKFHKIKDLPENAKPYEKTLFNELFSNQKININKIRLEVLDYCFKMGWIKDPFWSHPWNKGKFVLALFVLFFLVLLFWSSEKISILIWILCSPILILILICPWEDSNSILSNPDNKKKCHSRTILTKQWKQLERHLLWYKKFLKKIKITTRTDTIDDGTLSDRISLKVNNWWDCLNYIKNNKVDENEESYIALFDKRQKQRDKIFFNQLNKHSGQLNNSCFLCRNHIWDEAKKETEDIFYNS